MVGEAECRVRAQGLGGRYQVSDLQRCATCVEQEGLCEHRQLLRSEVGS